MSDEIKKSKKPALSVYEGKFTILVGVLLFIAISLPNKRKEKEDKKREEEEKKLDPIMKLYLKVKDLTQPALPKYRYVIEVEEEGKKVQKFGFTYKDMYYLKRNVKTHFVTEEAVTQIYENGKVVEETTFTNIVDAYQD
jgi:hypothetical protein